MGKLIIVGTPIGNLEDITIRALKTLREVDLILAEDTRRTMVLLNKYRIKKPLLSFNERNSKKRIKEILPLLKEGKKVAIVSDAGMPVISDPGYNLVEECWREGIEVDIVPGPSALTSAVAVSGFPGSKFIFEGFCRAEKQKKTPQILEERKQSNRVFRVTGKVTLNSERYSGDNWGSRSVHRKRNDEASSGILQRKGERGHFAL